MKPALLLCLLTLLSLPLPAQQTANAELDSCIRDEQKSKARKGAVLGFLGGLLESVSGSRQDGNGGGGASVRIGFGAAGGSALGLGLAYYTAVDTCLKRNPQWIPASRLERDADYAAAVTRHGYEAAQGPLLRLLALEGPATASAGSELQLQGRLLLLTPQGEEASLRIERRLFVRADGQEQELRYLGHAQEQRVLAAGEHLDRARLPLPKDMPAGVEFRYLLSVALDGQPPVLLVHTVTLQ